MAKLTHDQWLRWRAQYYALPHDCSDLGSCFIRDFAIKDDTLAYTNNNPEAERDIQERYVVYH